MNLPLVRRSRLVAAEATVARLNADNANQAATIQNLVNACAHYTTAIGTLQRMLAQQQVTFLMAPYWASQPAQETQEGSRAAE